MFKQFQKSTVMLLVAALMLALPFHAMAHEATRGPNGGALVDVEGHHIEFVPGEGEFTFYLTGEKDAPIDSVGSKLKAIILDGGKTQQVDLTPSEPNKLTAEASASSGAKVVVSGTLADGHALQARFVVP